MAGGVSTYDARALAPDMRTSADFVLSQPKLHFACHIRNVTPQAVSIPIDAGKLEREPRLSEEEYDAVRRRNRERVSLGLQPAPPPQPEPSRPPKSKRKRPKLKRHPLTGDIDTSA